MLRSSLFFATNSRMNARINTKIFPQIISILNLRIFVERTEIFTLPVLTNFLYFQI